MPGASAGIALSVGACMTRADGRLMEQLPTTAGMRSLVLMQPGHHYKYDRCARMTGAHIVEGDLSSFADVACVLHPAHLDGKNGTLPLAEVAERAHEHGVPVVVDAAYMSYPDRPDRELRRAGRRPDDVQREVLLGPERRRLRLRHARADRHRRADRLHTLRVRASI